MTDVAGLQRRAGVAAALLLVDALHDRMGAKHSSLLGHYLILKTSASTGSSLLIMRNIDYDLIRTSSSTGSSATSATPACASAQCSSRAPRTTAQSAQTRYVAAIIGIYPTFLIWQLPHLAGAPIRVDGDARARRHLVAADGGRATAGVCAH